MGMPNCCSWSSGPMPESMSRWGDLIAPALSTTRSASTVKHLPTALGFHTHGLAILDHDLPDKHPAPHRQIQIVAHRIEMRESHAHAHPVQVIRGRHAQAGGVRAIRVLRGAKPRLHTGGMEGRLEVRPGT